MSEPLPAVTAAREALRDAELAQAHRVTPSPVRLISALRNLLAVVDRLTAPPADWPIPRYAMLDIWMALYGSERSEEFEAFADEHGFAETWARLCAEVRGLTAPPSEEEIEALRRIIARGSYSRFPDDLPYADVAARIVAASGRRHLPTEPEWEYGLYEEDPHQERERPHRAYNGAHLVSDNRAHVETQWRRGNPSIKFAHRRAPGPWEVCDEQ